MINAKLDKVITFRLSKKLYKKLHKYAQKNQIPPSLAIRRWLSEKLKHIKD